MIEVKYIEAANLTALATAVNDEYPEYQAYGNVIHDGTNYVQTMTRKYVGIVA